MLLLIIFVIALTIFYIFIYNKWNQLKLQQNAYIILNNSKVYLLIYYGNLLPDQLKKALPYTYIPDKNRTILVSVFDAHGIDYLGQYSKFDLILFLTLTKHTTILDKEFNDLSDDYKIKIDIQLFNEWKDFATKLLN